MVKKAQSVTRKVTKNRTRTLNELRKLKNRVKPGLDFEQQIGIYIREFARTGCKSHAARAAGFSDSYATEVFKSMMSDPAIKKRIQDSCRSRIKRLDLDIDRLVQELVILVHSRFTDVAEIEDGQLIIANTTQLSDLDIAAISKVSENKTERTSKNPETGEIETTITTRINVELYDRIAAARELIRILGLDKSEDALITGFGQYGYDIVRDANGKYVMIDRRSQAVEEAETAAETS
jgi:phage terminase small subunit